MLKFQSKKSIKSGFTIVELLIVIAVIGILATITVIGYGSWRHSTLSAAVKSDLSGVISAMENSRTFNNGYPTTLPTTFTPSNGTTLTIDPSSSSTAYCINGTSVNDASINFYVSSTKKAQGAIQGTCADLNNGTLPGVPINLASTAVGGSTISLSWNAGSGGTAATYTAQCASDMAYIQNFGYITVSSTNGTVSGLANASTYYCRISATNASGNSPWSDSISINTNAHGCSDTGQYGTYPDCYAYDALPIASSIEGYWTTAPTGYLIENGSAISRTTYADLFASIGTTYGNGDGSTTFNLPDSRGRTAVNISAADTEFNTIGQKYGEKTHLLTIAEMPSHNHGAGSDGGGYPVPQGSYYGLTNTQGFATVGGSTPYNVIQPSIVKQFAIKFRPSTGTASMLSTATSIEGYWTSAPTGYLLEDGSAVSRTTYSALYATIGTTYGTGDGSTTFNLPDSRGRAMVNQNPSDSEFATIGQKYGEKTHLLTIAELPSHNHGPGASGVYLVPQGSYYGLTAPGAPVNTGGGQVHNVIQPSIVKTFAIKYTAASGSVDASPKATSIEGYWTSAPTGYLLEDGSAVSRTTYSALYATIGTTYGTGDGSTTFNLPDSRGRVGVNLNTSDTQFATIGQKFGEKTHVLTIAEMPAHSHGNGTSGTAYLTPQGSYYGLTSVGSPVNVGGNVAHNVIQPSIVKKFAIKY